MVEERYKAKEKEEKWKELCREKWKEEKTKLELFCGWIRKEFVFTWQQVRLVIILVPLTLFLKHFSTGNWTLSATSSLSGCKVYTSSRRAGAIFSLTTSGMVKVPFWPVRTNRGTNKEGISKNYCSSSQTQQVRNCTSQWSDQDLADKLNNFPGVVGPGFNTGGLRFIVDLNIFRQDPTADTLHSLCHPLGWSLESTISLISNYVIAGLNLTL